MEKFTANGLIHLYKKMGLKDPKFFDEKNVVNLYKILGIEPCLNENGIRILTPYEILRVKSYTNNYSFIIKKIWNQ